jgi:DinB superfamily
MTTETRNALIASYSTAYTLLTDALSKMPQEMWQWRPAIDKWTIHEIIIHITDSEANSYIRCRRLIAEPTSGVYGYDENKWATALLYHDQSIAESLALFKMLRSATYQLIKQLPESIWTSATVHHSEAGVITMEQWLETYTEHIPIHIRQMERNLTAYQLSINS